MTRVLAAGLRAALGGIVMTVTTACFGLMAFAFAAADPASTRVDELARRWSRLFLLVANTRLTVVGADKLESGSTCVIVANHASDLDIPVCLAASPVSIRFLAKKEVFRIPILGRLMHAIDMVRVDRKAGPAGHDEVNNQIRTTLSHGHSLLIFAEGTRTRTGELAPFKRGAFRVAVDHHLDIVPMSIHGTHAAWPPATPWVYGGDVTVVIHDPISVDGLGHDDIDQVLTRAHQTIANELSCYGAGPTTRLLGLTPTRGHTPNPLSSMTGL